MAEQKNIEQELVDYIHELINSGDKTPEMVTAITGLYAVIMGF
ncbi:hypothetical protein [Levilactobacillus acidifarinae]|nr:hypothetical protein [Levilactobacillus acidifarinae]GEO70495.1 hypothetical protein LAC03_24050 [Levilactobacillus acidifarinae]